MKQEHSLHIVCLRFSSMGDVLLQSPIMSQLKSEYGENCRVTLVTAQEFAPLFEGHPHLYQVRSFSRKQGLSKLFGLIKDIDKELKINFIFDLHNTLRANFVKWRFWKIPKIAVDKRAVERKLLVQRIKIRLLSKELMTTRVLEDFNFLWKNNFDIEKLSAFISPEHKSQRALTSLAAVFSSGNLAQETLTKFNLNSRDYIVLIPSAAHISKRWPVERYTGLALKIVAKYPSQKVVVLAGPEDDFCRVFDNLHPNILNLAAKTSVQESTEIVGRAKLCIGNDTGMSHIAEAQLTPCFMIMGPTSEEFGFFPHLKDSRVFSHPMSCRPCSSNGSRQCYREELYCLTQTSVDDVFEQVARELL